MIIENPEALKTWLTTVLAPLCDADPAALAKYVLALAKKEKPESELRVAMIDQLDVFLQQETKGFVDKLFVTLDSKSYLQSNPEAPTIVEEVPTVNGAAIAATVEGDKSTDVTKDAKKRTPTSSTATTASTASTTTATERIKRKSFSPKSRSRSRSRERPRRSRSRDRTRDRGARGWEDRRRRSPVGRRTDRRRSRSPARRSRSPRNRRPYSNRSRSRSPAKGVSPRSPVVTSSAAIKEATDGASAASGPGTVGTAATGTLVGTDQSISAAVTLPIQSVIVTPDSRPKFRCRDYDEKGYCMRGDLCPYDHGADPVVLEEVELSSMLKFNRPPPGAPPVGPPPHMRGPPPSLPPPGEPYNPDAPGISWPPPPYAAGSSGGPPGMSGMRPLGPPGNGGAGYNAPPPFGHLSRMPPPHIRGSGALGARGGPPPPRGPPPMGLLGPAPPPRELISVPTNLHEEGGESAKRSGKEAGLDYVTIT